MSDNTGTGAATSAAELLGGEGGGAGTNTGGAATTSGTATTSGDGGSSTISGGAGEDWLEGIDDAELKGWAKNKAFPTVKDALASARNLETLLGREKLPLPKDEKDVEGYERIYKALGKPDEPAAYGLDKLEGASPEFAASAAEVFHKAGLSPKQASDLAQWWQGQQTQAVKDLQEKFQTQSRTDMADLGKEWGSSFEAKVEQARRASRQFGITKEDMAGMEQAIGTKKLMTMLAKIGGGLTEDSFEGEEGKGGFGMSVEQAQERLNSLMADKAYAKAYIGGDATKRQEVERLNRIISGSN